MNRIHLTRTVHAAVFAALIILGTFIRVPIGPVPIVMANFFVILAGLFLGPLWGTVSVLLYLLLGAVGFPVFSAGGGIAVFAGPTGGYLMGYPAGACIAGLISRRSNKKLPVLLTAAAVGTGAVYLAGVPWLMWRVSSATGEYITLARGLMTGFFPFLPGDIFKMTAAAVAARSLNRLTFGYMQE